MKISQSSEMGIIDLLSTLVLCAVFSIVVSNSANAQDAELRKTCELARAAAMLGPTKSGLFTESLANSWEAYANCMQARSNISKEDAEKFLMGGANHDIFLGCLNCRASDRKSYCNQFGYGSSINFNSIFNSFGKFGNSFNSESPWNSSSSSKAVPVIVDRKGNFYGYFTTNSYRKDAANFAGLLSQAYKEADGDLGLLRSSLCKI